MSDEIALTVEETFDQVTNKEMLKLEINKLISKYGSPKGGLGVIGKRKISLVLGELLKLIEALETQVIDLSSQVADLNERVPVKRKRGRPKGSRNKVREDEI